MIFKAAFALAASAALAACATHQNQPIVEGTPVAQGMAVPLDQPVHVGALVATPKEVVEDSRCPQNARCVHAGRLVVNTRIDGPGWRETVPLTLGEPFATHGTTITLVSGLPEKQAETQTPPGAYRFAYQGGN